MKKGLNIISLAILLIIIGLSIFGLSSCLNEEETELSVFTDAYVIKKNIDNDIFYGIACYVYGNKQISTANVTTPEGTVLQLTQAPGDIYTMTRETGDGEFSTDTPVTGNYLFEGTAESGEVFENTDYLDFDDIDIPTFETEYDDGLLALHITWDTVFGADGYVVKLKDSDGDVFYIGHSLSAEAVEDYISTSLGSWSTSPSGGETYTLVLVAFVYETDAPEGYEGYNIKEVSIAEEEIICEE